MELEPSTIPQTILISHQEKQSASQNGLVFCVGNREVQQPQLSQKFLIAK